MWLLVMPILTPVCPNLEIAECGGWALFTPVLDSGQDTDSPNFCTGRSIYLSIEQTFSTIQSI